MSAETAVAWDETKIAACCPKCRCDDSYHLSDGRRMCKHCRTKFTLNHRPGRLPDRTVRELTRHFWRMSRLDEAAQRLDVNRKTASRYYMTLRNLIARRCENTASPRLRQPSVDAVVVGRCHQPGLSHGPTDTVTVFCLVQEAGRVRLIFTRPWHDWSGLEFSSLKAKSLTERKNDRPEEDAALDAARDFLSFAKERLARYRGGFMKELPLYLREMEYRFNHRRDDLAVQRLQAMLKAGPV